MRPIIEFCSANMAFGTEAVKQKLETNPEYDVIAYGCLGNCGQCYYAPYALVNGEFIEAPTAEELYDRIIEAIGRLDDPYAWIDDEE